MISSFLSYIPSLRGGGAGKQKREREMTQAQIIPIFVIQYCARFLCGPVWRLTIAAAASSICPQQRKRSCDNSTVCCCWFCLIPADRSRLNAGSDDPKQQSGLLSRHLSKSASDLSTSRRDNHEKESARSVLAQTSTTQAHSTSNVPQVAHKTHHSFFSTLKVSRQITVSVPFLRGYAFSVIEFTSPVQSNS